MRRKIIIAVFVVAILLAVLMFYVAAHGQSFRMSQIMNGRVILKQAQQQLAKTGRVEPNGSWRPFVFTNDAIVDGVTQRCSVATHLGGFEDMGIFAMTTNQVFIWIDKRKPPKIVPASGYKPRFFSESF